MSVALVIGCFDPLHYGHIELLSLAQHVGESLVIGLTSDERLTAEKGSTGHPYFDFNTRAAGLKRLGYISAIIAHEGDDQDTIDRANASILIRGVEVAGDAETDAPQEVSVPVVTFNGLIRLSSTELITGEYLAKLKASR